MTAVRCEKANTTIEEIRPKEEATTRSTTEAGSGIEKYFKLLRQKA